MKRRQFVAGASSAVLATQTGIRGSSTDSQSYEALESDALPTDVTVAWIVDRFVQVRSENAPVVGADVTVPGYVLERVTDADEYEILRDRFDWDAVDYTGSDGLSRLFSPVAWPLESESVSSDVFESSDLLWVTGIHSDFYGGVIDGTDSDSAITTDREFAELYGHVPFVFALVPESESVESGTVATLTGTVAHTNGSDGELSAGSGGYLDLESTDATETLRTPNADWSEGSQAEFTGIQQHPQPRLTSVVTDVDYDDDMPRPTGGSLVSKVGTVDAAGNDPEDDDRATRHELTSDSHDVLVGETLHRSWDDDDDDDGVVNISLVVDTSGSMSERDTGWTGDDGGEKTRLEAAQESLGEFFDYIVDGHRVSLVAFDSDASIVTDATVVDDGSREDLRDGVDRLNDSGNTTIGGGMRRGMETIRDESGPKTMVLLSDGKENQSPSVDEVLPELRNHGIEVYTIGIGEDIDEAQLEYIANQTHARSLTADDPGKVREFYNELVSDSQQRSEVTKQEREVDEGDTMEGDCAVDSSCDDVQFVNTYEGSDMELTVRDPDGNEITEATDVNHRVGAAHEVWTVEEPPTGEWSYQLDVLQVDDPQQTTVRVNADSSVDADLFVSDDLYEQTGFVRFRLKVEEERKRYVGATAHLEVTPPDGSEDDVERITLYDDGGGPDDVSGDGIYSNYYHPTETGEYDVTAVIEGGEYPSLEREFDQSIEVDTVVDNPIRPYERRGGRSLLDDPFRLVLLGGMTLGSGWLFRSDASGAAVETTADETDRFAVDADDPDRNETDDGDGAGSEADAVDDVATEETTDDVRTDGPAGEDAEEGS